MSSAPPRPPRLSRAAVSAVVSKGSLLLARLTLQQAVFRLGDSVRATFDFTGAAVKCYQARQAVAS